MSQRVYQCPCGWRGLALAGIAPSACPQCAASTWTITSETHPRITRTCADCQTAFLGLRRSRYCIACRWRHRLKPVKKYRWTPERDAVLTARYDGKVRGRAAEIAQSFGWPKWVITKRAAERGLSYPADYKDWTDEETRVLTFYAGHRTVHWMAKRTGRSETAVAVKLKRMRISRAMGNGYHLRDLEACFGTDHHVIERWVDKGWLKIRRVTPGLVKSKWQVSEEALLRFIRAHPMAFRLDKVDHLWFLDLVFSRRTDPSSCDDEEAE